MDKKRIVIILIIILMFSLAITGSYIYYNDKYIVYFETGTNESIMPKYASKNDKISAPITPTKDGYVFVEWQLNGKTYDFNEKITSDTVLTAKWLKEDYVTINFVTNSNDVIESKKVLKGNIIDKLPVPNKDGYEFIGWYYNDKLYESQEVYNDLILTAEYKNDKINTTYKVGDMVLIIGKYSNTSKFSSAKNKKAIGWKRKILDIIDNAEFPYVVGDDSGITGFFKASSIEIEN